MIPDFKVTMYDGVWGESKPYPVAPGYPKLITDMLPGFPSNTIVDAVFTLISDWTTGEIL